jgi:hypothetical protein
MDVSISEALFEVAPGRGATLPWLLIHRLGEGEEQPALRGRSERGLWTFDWKELVSEVAAVARGLSGLDFRRGDSLLVFGGCRVRSITVMLAALSLGGKVLLLDPATPGSALRSLLRGRFLQVALADSHEQLGKLLSLQSSQVGRKVCDTVTAPYIDDAGVSYESLRRDGARELGLALGELAVCAGRVAETGTAFEVFAVSGKLSMAGSVEHAAAIETARASRRITSLNRGAEVVFSSRTAPVSSAAFVLAAWLDLGFTLVTIEDASLDVPASTAERRMVLK